MEHLLRDREIGDDAIAQRPDGYEVGWGPPDHALGFGADGEDLLVDAVDGDDGRLVNDDTAALDHHQGVGGTQVYGHIVGKQTQQGVERVEGQQFLPCWGLSGLAHYNVSLGVAAKPRGPRFLIITTVESARSYGYRRRFRC